MATNKSFVGWNTSADGKGVRYDVGQTVGSLSTVNNDVISLYAIWSDANLYKINYHNTKSFMTQYLNKRFIETENVTLPTISVLGYTFGGWYDASTDGTKVTGWNEGDHTSDVELWAKWTPITYKVEFNTNGGNPTELYYFTVLTFTYYQSLILSTKVYEANYVGGWRKGYKLESFNTKSNGSGTRLPLEEAFVTNLTTESGNTITVYAQWEKAFYDFDTYIFQYGDYVYEKTSFSKMTGGEISGSGTDGVFIEGRTVKLSDFYIGKYEVTQELYTVIMENGNLSDPVDKKNTYTANNVNWYQAIAFCNKLTLKSEWYNNLVYSVEGITDWENLKYSDIPTEKNATWDNASVDMNANGYRLPTEAEWEYASRNANTKGSWVYTYSGSNTIGNVAWYKDNSGSIVHLTGKKEVDNLILLQCF